MEALIVPAWFPVAVGLSAIAGRVNYTLSPGGTVVAGTGATISFGNQTAAATYTATATVVATGCTSNMNGSAVVTINAPPTVYAVTGGGDYCFGGSGGRLVWPDHRLV